MKLSKMTLTIVTLSLVALSVMTLSLKIPNKMTFSITTFRKTAYNQHKIMLSVTIKPLQYIDCRSPEGHYAECRGATLSNKVGVWL
jgi:hypothetical protein